MSSKTPESIFKCETCSQTYGSSSALLLHKRQHSPSKAPSTRRLIRPVMDSEPYEDLPCTECGKVFPSEFNLRSHMRWAHGTERFACVRCSKSYPVKIWLERHLQVVHQNDAERSGECNICHRLFPTEQELKLHRLSHDELRPHHCPHCPRIFRFKSNMLVHAQNAHSDVRRFWCYICGEAFKKKLDLKSHVDIFHLGLQRETCPFCSKSLKDEGTLKLHIKWVHDAPKMACKHCGRQFRTERNLQRHIMGVHTKEKVPVDEESTSKRKRSFVHYGSNIPPPIRPQMAPQRLIFPQEREMQREEEEVYPESAWGEIGTEWGEVGEEKEEMQGPGPVHEENVRVKNVRIKIMTF